MQSQAEFTASSLPFVGSQLAFSLWVASTCLKEGIFFKSLCRITRMCTSITWHEVSCEIDASGKKEARQEINIDNNNN